MLVATGITPLSGNNAVSGVSRWSMRCAFWDMKSPGMATASVLGELVSVT